MKTIGLLGGISWVSTKLYYELLNIESALRRGPGCQAPLVIKSFDYNALHELQKTGRNAEVADQLAKGARDLETIGAEVIAICANTMHRYYDQVQGAVQAPVLHVADACGNAIAESGLKTATLLGTKYTMECEFYRDRLKEKFGIETVIPDERERDEIERVIRTELTRSIVCPDSKNAFLRIIDRYAAEGSECAILGCTEIGLLVQQEDTNHPIFDTTIIHSHKLIDWALAN